jgi:hypothetical protein
MKTRHISVCKQDLLLEAVIKMDNYNYLESNHYTKLVTHNVLLRQISFIPLSLQALRI